MKSEYHQPYHFGRLPWLCTYWGSNLCLFIFMSMDMNIALVFKEYTVFISMRSILAECEYTLFMVFP